MPGGVLPVRFFIVLCIGGAGVLRVLIEGRLVHGDVSQDLVSGPSDREQPGILDIGVHLVNAADTDPQAFIGLIEVNKGCDNVLPSPPGPRVQVVAQEETLYRLDLMLPQGFDDGLGGPEVDQRSEWDELAGEMLMVPLVPGTRALLKEDVQHHNEVLTGVRPPTFGKAALLQYRARALVHKAVLALDLAVSLGLMRSTCLMHFVLALDGVNEFRSVIGVDQSDVVTGALEVAKAPLDLACVLFDARIEGQEVRFLVGHE